MARITQIIPTLPQVKPKLKVAAYARVSVDTEALMHSLSAQVSYYSSLIQNNPEWEYAGVYADEGISGTSTKHRDEFKRLVADCEAGKIDMVLVKSISRFARDTIDCLNTTRHLRELGISVYFEREKINSLSEDGELMLTLLASFAQEESRSISENIKWATRKRFEQGIPNGHKAPYGYEWDGEMFRIIPSQGEIVKEIYRRYLAGESAYGIAKSLAERGVTGQMGLPIEQSTIKEILSSESYTGTMVLQKNFYTENKTRKRNQGELPMYLVDEMFEPLVSEEDFRKAVQIRAHRAELFPNHKDNPTTFSGMVKCGYCGCGVSRRTSGDKKRWVCNIRERKGMKNCDCRPIDETELETAAATALGGSFDEGQFFKRIERVNLYSDKVDFLLKGGCVKSITREYSGRRGQNAFTNKVWCGVCATKCERDTWGKKRIKVWRCSKQRSECRIKRLTETELLRAAESLLGENFQPRVAAEVERVLLFEDKVDFEMKDGMVKTWQRE